MYAGKSVIQTQESQVEPDLMVRETPRSIPEKWPEMPTPILVVEVSSGVTHRRDRVEKRAFYLRKGVAHYCSVNRWDRTIRVITANGDDVTVSTQFTWHPTGASNAILIDVAEFFRTVLDRSTRHDVIESSETKTPRVREALLLSQRWLTPPYQPVPRSLSRIRAPLLTNHRCASTHRNQCRSCNWPRLRHTRACPATAPGWPYATARL